MFLSIYEYIIIKYDHICFFCIDYIYYKIYYACFFSLIGLRGILIYTKNNATKLYRTAVTISDGLNAK